jgi:hypothetical protein
MLEHARLGMDHDARGSRFLEAQGGRDRSDLGRSQRVLAVRERRAIG